MSDEAPQVRVVDNKAAHRYEAWIGDQLVGWIMYQERPGLVVFQHTEIDPDFEGHGVGSRLTAAALDDVRARGLSVVPRCPFVAAFLRQHPDYADLVAD